MRRNRGLTALLVSAALLSASTSAFADEIYTFVIRKDEEKAKTRWNLSDWLETRDKMRLMDLWLALHSPSPYEFTVGGDYQLGQYGSGTSYSGSEFFAAAYASIFGLGIQAESNPDPTAEGLFLARIFGFHDQDTHVTLQAGVRQESNAESVHRNGLGGIDLTAYVVPSLGVKGLYQHYFAGGTDALGLAYSGNRYEGEAFIEFKFLRIFGKYFYETETGTGTPGSVSLTRNGVALGTQVYF